MDQPLDRLAGAPGDPLSPAEGPDPDARQVILDTADPAPDAHPDATDDGAGAGAGGSGAGGSDAGGSGAGAGAGGSDAGRRWRAAA